MWRRSETVEFLYAVEVVIGLKQTIYINKMFQVSLRGKHKPKTYSRYTQDKEKEIKVYHQENHQFTKEDSKKRTMEQQNTQKKQLER